MLTESLAPPVILEDYREQGGPHLAKIKLEYNREGAHSRNRRTYKNVAEWVEDANGEIQAGRSISMYTSHGAALSDATLEQFGKLTRTYMAGDTATAEGLVANTTAGRDVLTLIEGGYVRSISQRMGPPVEITKLEAADAPDGEPGWVVITRGRLCGIDITNNPGIERTSIAVAESADGEYLVESFALEVDGCCGSCAESRPCPEDSACTCGPECSCRQMESAPYWERDFTQDQRDQAAKDGAALPDGSFPIRNAGDLKNAIRLVGHAKDPAAAKAHIIKRARALGLTAQLPDDWKESQGDDMTPDEQARADLTEALNNAIPGADETPEVKPSADAATLEAAIAAVVGQNTPEPVEAEEPVAETAETDTTDDTIDEAFAKAEKAAKRLRKALKEGGYLEAGRKISAANMAKLKSVHDAVNDVATSNGGSMFCDSDNDGDESTAESVEASVQTALQETEKRWAARFDALKAEYDEKLEAATARRKSSARTGYVEHSTPMPEDLQNMTEAQRWEAARNALAAELKAIGAQI